MRSGLRGQIKSCFVNYISALFLFTGGLLASLDAQAQSIIHETEWPAPPCGPPNCGGNIISQAQFIGIRFQLDQPTTITGVGGHFYTFSDGGGSLFGAVIRLSGPAAFPQGQPFLP